MFTSPSNFILKRKKTLSQKPVIHVDSLSSKCVIDKDKELRLTLNRAWTKLKISFATDSRINGGAESNSFLNKPKFIKI